MMITALILLFFSICGLLAYGFEFINYGMEDVSEAMVFILIVIVAMSAGVIWGGLFQ